jgi:hypothetical protein
MALEDLTSQYGPQNANGTIGTGTSVDTFADEGTAGLVDKQSMYAHSSSPGTKVTGPDVFGNIPAEGSGL